MKLQCKKKGVISAVAALAVGAVAASAIMTASPGVHAGGSGSGAEGSSAPGPEGGWITGIDADGNSISMSQAEKLKIETPRVDYDELYVYIGIPFGKTYVPNRPDSFPSRTAYDVPPEPQDPDRTDYQTDQYPNPDDNPAYQQARAQHEKDHAAWKADPRTVAWKTAGRRFLDANLCQVDGFRWSTASDPEAAVPASGSTLIVDGPVGLGLRPGCIASIAMVAVKDDEVVAMLDLPWVTSGYNHIDGGYWQVSMPNGSLKKDADGNPEFQIATEIAARWNPPFPQWAVDRFGQAAVDARFPCDVKRARGEETNRSILFPATAEGFDTRDPVRLATFTCESYEVSRNILHDNAVPSVDGVALFPRFWGK